MRVKIKAEYDLCRQKILNLILRDKFREGDRFHSCNQLTVLLDFGRISIQRAMKKLVCEGILETINKKGTYVKRIPDKDEIKSDLTGAANQNAGAFGDLGIVKSRRKILKIGVLADMPHYDFLWKQIAINYTKRNDSVQLELIRVDHESQYLDKDFYRQLDIFQINSANRYTFAHAGLLMYPGLFGKLDIGDMRFYPCALDATTVDDKIIGTPFVCSVNCVYYNTDYKSKIKSAMKTGGFWERHEILSELSANLKPRSDQAILANNHSIVNMFYFTNPSSLISLYDFISTHRDAALKFFEKFLPYFQDERIYLPLAKYSYPSVPGCFFGKQAMAINGSTSWLHNMQKSSPVKWGLAITATEGDNSIPFEANINVISPLTMFPEESVDALNYLASGEVLSLCAKAGRLVPDREALSSLRINSLDEDSYQSLIKSLSHAKAIYYEDLFTMDYLRQVLNYEFIDTHKDKYVLETFMDRLVRKIDYFLEVKRRRHDFEALSKSEFKDRIPSFERILS